MTETGLIIRTKAFAYLSQFTRMIKVFTKHPSLIATSSIKLYLFSYTCIVIYMIAVDTNQSECFIINLSLTDTIDWVYRVFYFFLSQFYF